MARGSYVRMSDAAAISYEHVSKDFDGVQALDDVSLAIRKGEFLVVVGGSGSGKTTLLRLANRLIEPTQGRVAVEGEAIADGDPVALRRRIGTVFQNGALFPQLDVAGNVGITPRLLGTPPKQIAARVDDLLDLVQLDPSHYRNRMPHELSGGQRQRVGVARALAASPAIVLMDEPFGALDPLTRDALGDDYRALHDKLGLTTMMITHDITEALLLGDRIAVMHGGRLVAADTPSQLAQSPESYVHQLFGTPRRQAARLSAVLRP